MWMASTPSSLLWKKHKTHKTFQTYIETLPKWEQMLLTGISEKQNSYANLETHLKMGSALWIATDGGAKGPLGYFGWVIATDTNILWKGKGQAYSNPDLIESLRAESIGLLAAIRFLYRYIQYNNITPNIDAISHYCDNSTLCK